MRQIPTRYSPVRHSPPRSKLLVLPFDLHVLGMPPAFNLSLDQTLRLKLETHRFKHLCFNLFWPPLNFSRRFQDSIFIKPLQLKTFGIVLCKDTHTNCLAYIVKELLLFSRKKPPQEMRYSTAFFLPVNYLFKKFLLKYHFGKLTFTYLINVLGAGC